MSVNFQVTLVRHGQTAANKAQIIQGNADVPLSDVGKNQAIKLGSHFNKTGASFTHVYASDLSRALETAQLVIGDKQSIITDKRLRERAFGVVEGKSIESYRAAAREAGFKEKELSYFTPEGGETLPQVNQRVKAFFTDLIDHLKTSQPENESKILIVTHGGVIREFMRFFRDDCRCDFKGGEIMIVTSNTGVNIFNIYILTGNKVKAEVVKIHDTTHLQGDNPDSNSTKSQVNVNDNHTDKGKSDDDAPPLVAL